MRLGRWVAGVAVAAILSAVAVAPALAKEMVEREFEASAGGKTTNVSLGPQQFKFGIFKITCAGASSTGEATAGKSTELKDKVSFDECSTGKGKGKSEATLKAWEVEFFSNGTFEILNEPKISLPAAKCTIDVESGTVGEEELKKKPVSYKTVEPKKEEVKPRKLEIKVDVKPLHHEEDGIDWEYSEHKPCGKLEEVSGENGSWKGSLLDEAKEGELSIS
jgi:hypothetical protein